MPAQPAAVLLACVLLAPLLPAQEEAANSWTARRFLVTGALVHAGDGSTPRRRELLIDEGRIAAIFAPGEDLPDLPRFEATGRQLAPGFIDLHAHGDPRRTPGSRNFLAMGVTTIVLGQDGSSVRPAEMSEWMRTVARRRPALHVATLVGHGSLRRAAEIPDGEVADGAGRKRMRAALRSGLAAGAFGLSLGLEYTPGRFADLEELRALTEIVGTDERVVMAHLRSEDADRILGAVRELLAACQETGARPHVAHLKIVHGRGAAAATPLLELFARTRADGVPLTADIYPYAASYTGLSILFPDWARPPHDYATVREARGEELLGYLERRVHARNGPEATLLASGRFRGQTLAAAAQDEGVPFPLLLRDTLGPQGGSAAYFVMDEEVIARLLAMEDVAVASDGSPSMRHPRGHGTFARVLGRALRGEGPLDVRTAIHRMSGLPARILGLEDRGRIAVGATADLALFDPEAVADPATFLHPFRRAEGFTVFVAGRLAWHEGRPTAERTGRVLRHGAAEIPSGG